VPHAVKGVTKANYDTHCQSWAHFFQKLAHEPGANCFVKFPDHPADEAAKDIWGFLVKRRRP
jgi:hypothetical protein